MTKASRKLGATGEFPRGKLNAHDEGSLKIAIGVQDKTVIINFGTQVVWFGLDKRGAIQFANSIIDAANEIYDA